MAGIDDQIVLSRRHGTRHQERRTSALVVPTVTDCLCRPHELVSVPTAGRRGRALDRSIRNIKDVHQMRLECIKTLVMHQPLENRQRETLSRVVEMATSSMPAAIHRESAQASKGSSSRAELA